MTSIASLLPKPTPRSAKVILLDDKIVVAATRGGNTYSAGTLSTEHVVLPLDVDDFTLFEAISAHLWKHQHPVKLPRPSYPELYLWLERPDIIADVDVIESAATVELRFPIPGTEKPSGSAVFARETFSKDSEGYVLSRTLKLMLQARRDLLSITGAPKSRAADGSPAAA